MSTTFTGFKSFEKKIATLGKRMGVDDKSAVVGVLGSQGSDMVMIAAVNEYGTSDGHIPSRPFLRNALKDPTLVPFVRRMAAQYTQGKLSLDAALNKVGAFTVGLIQRSIGSNIQPANAPSTVAAKGSSATLINTGRLRQSITWVIK